MPSVKFEISADASSLLREDQRVITSQDQTAGSFRATVSAAQTANTDIANSIKQTAEAYELAEETVIRFKAAASRPTRIQPLKLAPDVPTRIAPPAVRPTGAPIYELADEVAAAKNDALYTQRLSDWAKNQDRVDAIRGEVHAEAMAHEQSLREGELESFRAKMAAQREGQAEPGQLGQDILAGGMAVGVASAAFSQAFDHVSEILDKTGQAGASFQRDITPLLSLGNNLSNIQGIKEKVLADSDAFGLATGNISSALFMLQSNASNFSEQTRDAILGAAVGFQKVAGGDLQTGLVAITKLMQNFGGQLKTPDVAAGKLLKTEELAAITPDELSSLLPDVLPAAKLMGHTYDEVAASVITATQAMGSNHKTLTGLRNLYLKMPEAVDAGLVSQGHFVDQLHQLAAVDPQTLSKIFGERTVSVVAALAAHTADVAKNLQIIAATGGSAVMQKFLATQQDPAARDAALLGSVTTETTNVDAIRAQDATLRDQDLDIKLTELGYEATVPNWAKELDLTGLAKKAQVAYALTQPDAPISDDWGGSRRNDFKRAGIEATISEKLKAGDKQSAIEADLLKLKYGADTGTSLFDPGGDSEDAQGRAIRYTGNQDAQRYAELLKRRPKLGLKTFLDFEQMQLADPAAAQKYLDTHAPAGESKKNPSPVFAPAPFVTSGPITPDFLNPSDPGGPAPQTFAQKSKHVFDDYQLLSKIAGTPGANPQAKTAWNEARNDMQSMSNGGILSPATIDKLTAVLDALVSVVTHLGGAATNLATAAAAPAGPYDRDPLRRPLFPRKTGNTSIRREQGGY